MQLDVIERYLPLYGQAALVTLQISLLGIVLALAVGLVGALLREARGYGHNDFKIPLARRVLIATLKELTA